jgi:hypothetical protein
MTHQQWLEEPYEADDRYQRELEWRLETYMPEDDWHPHILSLYERYLTDEHEPVMFETWLECYSVWDILEILTEEYLKEKNNA